MLRRTAQVIACTLMFASPAAAQVVDFESLGAGCNNAAGNVGTISGVAFDNSWTCYSFAQNPYNPSSGRNRVYTSSLGSFSFSPAQFSGAYFAGNGSSLYFQLFMSSVQVATSGVLVTSSTPTFLASGYSGGVDKVVVNGSPGFYVMDDVTVGAAVVATPEPASVLLMGTGLLGLFGVARRKRS